ncbi:MAG: hypothetical protein GOVbin4162_58 [Prokaryotic dsDNA virus sp.]|nr:MAG: hypothetical protein GOVbin4162_58 [Prokaryotic dsDNA virus sp.]|tara:strand:- start:4907 stop:6109 length:1203 start_codon:yes stop_codon:yes gene_type:complete
MIIVGSTAAKYWWDDWRDPNDLDLWHGENSIYMKGDGEDVHILPNEVMRLIPDIDGYAPPDVLYTIKLSHSGWDNHAWEKHKQDALLMQSKGCKLIPALYDALVQHWRGELGNKDFLSLSQNKEDFFTDNVTYVYDHDWLHSVVSYPNDPVYSKILKDGEDVLVDKEKFNSLPFEQQVRMFREEMTVIAMERWVIPSKGKICWWRAWQWSLRKTITSLTKGWATSFIVLNLEHFIKPEYSYFKNIMEEFNMSNKVDLAPFEKALELGLQSEMGDGLKDLVYSLCEGDSLDASDDSVGLKYPDRGGRPYDDPNYLKEVNTYWDAKRQKEEEIFEQLGGYEHLEQEGGGEGGSEYCYGVFRLGDKIYRAEYSYYSYHGHEYDYILDTLREVIPQQKTITVYE